MHNPLPIPKEGQRGEIRFLSQLNPGCPGGQPELRYPESVQLLAWHAQACWDTASSSVGRPAMDMQPRAKRLNVGRSVSRARRWFLHLHRQLPLQSNRNAPYAPSNFALWRQALPLTAASSAEGRDGVGMGVQAPSAPFSWGERSGQYFPA